MYTRNLAQIDTDRQMSRKWGESFMHQFSRKTCFYSSINQEQCARGIHPWSFLVKIYLLICQCFKETSTTQHAISSFYAFCFYFAPQPQTWYSLILSPWIQNNKTMEATKTIKTFLAWCEHKAHKVVGWQGWTSTTIHLISPSKLLSSAPPSESLVPHSALPDL